MKLLLNRIIKIKFIHLVLSRVFEIDPYNGLNWQVFRFPVHHKLKASSLRFAIMRL